MSFFAQLLAGAASGVGKGMVDQADYNDKLAAQQALLQEKQANALQLQQQRADDRLFQAQTMAALKGEGGGSGGGDVFARLLAAKTPEEQQRQLGVIAALGGDDAAHLAQEKILGRAPTVDRPADFVGMPGQSDIGPDAKVLERVNYDREKGAQGLQRVYALIASKGNTKGHAEGEDQYLSNDLRVAGIQKAMNDGKPLDQASAYGSRVADPATYDKNQTNADRVAASEKNAQAKLDASEARRLADLAKAEAKTLTDLDKAILDYEKLKKDASPKDRAVYDAVILDLKTRRSEAAPASASSKPTGSSAPVAGSSTKPPVMRPKDAIRAAGY